MEKQKEKEGPSYQGTDGESYEPWLGSSQLSAGHDDVRGQLWAS